MTIKKGINPLIFLAKGQIVSLLFFYKDGFGIKQPINVDMSLDNKKFPNVTTYNQQAVSMVYTVYHGKQFLSIMEHAIALAAVKSSFVWRYLQSTCLYYPDITFFRDSKQYKMSHELYDYYLMNLAVFVFPFLSLR